MQKPCYIWDGGVIVSFLIWLCTFITNSRLAIVCCKDVASRRYFRKTQYFSTMYDSVLSTKTSICALGIGTYPSFKIVQLLFRITGFGVNLINTYCCCIFYFYIFCTEVNSSHSSKEWNSGTISVLDEMIKVRVCQFFIISVNNFGATTIMVTVFLNIIFT